MERLLGCALGVSSVSNWRDFRVSADQTATSNSPEIIAL
jgi:hypothetical protein